MLMKKVNVNEKTVLEYFQAAQKMFERFKGNLLEAIIAYQSSWSFRLRRWMFSPENLSQTRVKDIRALQDIINASKTVQSLSSDILDYLDGPKNHFQWAWFSPLRSSLRNEIEQFRMHHSASAIDRDLSLASFSVLETPDEVETDTESALQSVDESSEAKVSRRPSFGTQTEVSSSKANIHQQIALLEQKKLKLEEIACRLKEEKQRIHQRAESVDQANLVLIQGQQTLVQDAQKLVNDREDLAQQKLSLAQATEQLQREKSQIEATIAGLQGDLQKYKQAALQHEQNNLLLQEKTNSQALLINRLTQKISSLGQTILALAQKWSDFQKVSDQTVLSLKNMFEKVSLYFQQSLADKQNASKPKNVDQSPSGSAQSNKKRFSSLRKKNPDAAQASEGGKSVPKARKNLFGSPERLDASLPKEDTEKASSLDQLQGKALRDVAREQFASQAGAVYDLMAMKVDPDTELELDVLLKDYNNSQAQVVDALVNAEAVYANFLKSSEVEHAQVSDHNEPTADSEDLIAGSAHPIEMVSANFIS